MEGIDPEDFIPLDKTVQVNTTSQQWVKTDCGPAASDTLSFGKQSSKVSDKPAAFLFWVYGSILFFKWPGWDLKFYTLFMKNVSITWTERYNIMKQMVFCGKWNKIKDFYCCTVHFDISTVHSPTNALFYFEKQIKIYIKIHINIAPTCFGLRPSSGSLHWTWLKLYLC